jgi:hypothetical protein
MVCELCASLDRARQTGDGTRATGSPAADPWTCEVCRKPLSSQGLLTKLSQLARFGLAGPPLLELSRRRP